MSKGLLISNQDTINLIKNYMNNPNNAKDKTYAKQALHDLASTHLPAFKTQLKSIINPRIKGYSFKDTSIFTSFAPIDTDEMNNKQYQNLINQKKQNTTVTNYLYFLKQQRLLPTQSALSTITNINHNTILKVKDLLKVALNLIPKAKQAWKRLSHKKINQIVPKLQQNQAYLKRYQQIAHHWYTRKKKKNWAKQNINALNNSITDYHKQINKIKENYNSKEQLYDKLIKLNTTYSPNLYKNFSNSITKKLTHVTYIEGKPYSYEPFDLKYQGGCVKVTLDNFNSKNKRLHQDFIYKTLNNPNADADLFIKAIYQTISELPYLNLNHVANGYSFAKDMSAKELFEPNNDFTFMPEYYSKSNGAINFSNSDCVHDYQQFIQKSK